MSLPPLLLSEAMSDRQPLIVGNLVIQPPLALAPMVGLSHSALRSLVMELGGVGLLYTEMLSARRLPQENEKVSPFLIRSPQEYPLFYQLVLHEESSIEKAVEKVQALGAQGIDLNLGCPAPKLRRQGAGCALSANRAAVRTILAALRRLTSLPLSVKIRLGQRLDTAAFLDLCRIIEAEGADCLTVHARLDGEKFCRKPRWEWVARAKENVNIPVLANGGIFTVEDARKCLRVTGADGLMLGRGGVARPWIFAEIAAMISGKRLLREALAMSNVYRRFAELLRLRFPPERRLGRLKEFTHYFACSYTYGHHLASGVQTSASFTQAVDRAERFFLENEHITIS